MKSLFPYILILAFTIFVWYLVLNQALIGEGPIYFNEPYLSILNHHPLEVLWSRHDSQALLFFRLTKDVFRDDVKLYMWALLVGSSFVSISLFALVRKITGSALAALVTCAIFIANFVGSFEILGLGYYQWFIQRVPNFGLALIGLYFFIVFFEKKKQIFYYFSFLLYVLSVFLARYTIHILPFFIFYSFFVNFLEGKGKTSKRLSFFLVTSIPFIIASYILFKAQGLVSGTKEINSLKEMVEFLPNVFYQITYLTFPFLKLVPRFMFADAVKLATISAVAFYIVASYLLLKKVKKIRPFLLSIVFSLPISVFLSMVLNPYFVKIYDSSRYLYYSSILSSSFLGIFSWYLWRKINILKFAIIIFMILSIAYNKRLIDEAFSYQQEKHNPVLATLRYIKENEKSLEKYSLIMVPKEVGHYGAGMLTYLYGKDNRIFLIDDPEKGRKTIRLKYNPLTNRIGQ